MFFFGGGGGGGGGGKNSVKIVYDWVRQVLYTALAGTVR